MTRQTVHEQLKQTLVGYEELQLVLPAKIDISEDVGFAVLNKLGFINHPDGLHFLDEVFSSNFAADYKGPSSLHIKGYVNQIQQILLPVAQGVGYTILQKRAVQQFSQQQQLKIVPLTNATHEALYLTQKRYRQLPARYQWFETKIMQLLK